MYKYKLFGKSDPKTIDTTLIDALDSCRGELREPKHGSRFELAWRSQTLVEKRLVKRKK